MRCPDPNPHGAHIWYEPTTTKGGTIQVARFCPGVKTPENDREWAVWLIESFHRSVPST